MKKIFFAMATVALLFATSCKNSNSPEDITLGDGEFLATIDNTANPQNAPVVSDGMTTKTTIDANRNVFWESGDQISINGSTYTTDMSGSTVKFTGGNATGTEYDAFFPATIAGTGAAGTLPAVQTYEEGKVNNLPLYAHSTTNQLKFNNICGVMKITIPEFIKGADRIVISSDQRMNGAFTLTPEGQGYKAVVAAPTTDADKKVTISKSSGTFATGEDVYIAAPAQIYYNFKIEIFSGSTSKWCKTANSPCTLQVNKIHPVNITVMENLLPRVFSVSATQQVLFTKGNLTGEAPDYEFEEHQYGLNSSYQWTTDWQSTVTVSGKAYRLLTKDEWDYLINERAMTGSTPRYKFVRIDDDDNALALYPDTYTGSVQDAYDQNQYEQAERDGVVFLFSEDSDEGSFSHYYWTATPISTTGAYSLFFHFQEEDQTCETNSDDIASFHPIRLVKDI